MNVYVSLLFGWTNKTHVVCSCSIASAVLYYTFKNTFFVVSRMVSMHCIYAGTVIYIYIYTFMDKQNVFLDNNTLLPIKTTGYQYRYNMLLYQSERLEEYAVHSMLTDNGEVFKL